MAEVELLPPLYRIVYEYLPVSEQWYVSALDQFTKFETTATDYDRMVDAVINDNMHVFLCAHKLSKTHWHHNECGVRDRIVELDRVEMLKLYSNAEMLIRHVYTSYIMEKGAVRVLRYARELGITAGFRSGAHVAASNGHLECLREFMRIDPGYVGDNEIFCSAVNSDDTKVVEFVMETWPNSSMMRIPGWIGPAWTMSGAHIKSLQMAKYLCAMLADGAVEACNVIWFQSVVHRAFALDSIEMIELVRAQPCGADLSVDVCYRIYASNLTSEARQALPTTKVYQYLAEKGLLPPDGGLP